MGVILNEKELINSHLEGVLLEMGKKKSFTITVPDGSVEKIRTLLQDNPHKYLNLNIEFPKQHLRVEGFIYVLQNEFMPDLIKIGYTSRDPRTRSEELYAGNTGIPGRFDVLHSWRQDDAARKEKELHRKCKKWRVNEKREFFKIECLPIVLIEMGQDETDFFVPVDTCWTQNIPFLLTLVNKVSKLTTSIDVADGYPKINLLKIFVRGVANEISETLRECRNGDKLPGHYNLKMDELSAAVKCYTLLKRCIEDNSVSSPDTLGDIFSFSMPLAVLDSLCLGVQCLSRKYQDIDSNGGLYNMFKLVKKYRSFERARDELAKCLEFYKIDKNDDYFINVLESFDNIICITRRTRG